MSLNHSCENLVHGKFGVNSFHIHLYYLLNDHAQALIAYCLLEPSQVHLILGLGWKSVHKHSYKLPLIAKIFNFTAKFSLKLLEFVESTPVSLGFRCSWTSFESSSLVFIQFILWNTIQFPHHKEQAILVSLVFGGHRSAFVRRRYVWWRNPIRVRKVVELSLLFCERNIKSRSTLPLTLIIFHGRSVYLFEVVWHAHRLVQQAMIHLGLIIIQRYHLDVVGGGASCFSSIGRELVWEIILENVSLYFWGHIQPLMASILELIERIRAITQISVHIICIDLIVVHFIWSQTLVS